MTNPTSLDTLLLIKKQLREHKVLLYMKGTPRLPQCGFSTKAVEALQATGIPFSYIDVLAEPEIRDILPKFANWPTFPQLYVNGKLIGGCEIILELFESGKLKASLLRKIK